MVVRSVGSAEGRGRRRTRRALAATVAAAALFSVGACASSSTGASGSGDKVTLRLTWWGDESRADFYQQALDIFQSENPGVTVQTEYGSYADYWTARNTEAAGKSLPDVFQMDLPYLYQYAQFEQIQPLDAFVGKEITTDDVSQPLLKSGQVDGKTYGIASSASTMGLFVNTQLLDTLGVPVPEAGLTWDTLDAFLAQVSKAGASQNPQVYGSADYTQFFWLFQTWLAQQGKSLIQDGKLGFDKADLAAWWKRSAAGHASGAFLPAARYEQLTGSGADDVGVGETAAAFSWDNNTVRYTAGSAHPTLSLLPLPADDLQGNSGIFQKPGLQMVMATNTKHPKESAKLIDFLVNDPRVGKIFGMSRGIPASSTALGAVVPNDSDQKIIDFEKTVAPYLVDSPAPAPGLSVLEQNFVTISSDVSYGTLSVDDAVNKWFDAATEALKG